MGLGKTVMTISLIVSNPSSVSHKNSLVYFDQSDDATQPPRPKKKIKTNVADKGSV